MILEIKKHTSAVFFHPEIICKRMIFRFRHSGIEDSFFITVPDNFRYHLDLVATCIVSIFAVKFKVMYFDFSTSKSCIDKLERISGCKLTSAGEIDPWTPGRDSYLAFSGGFDSLAGHLICPEHFKLASIDFGGTYERERKFFEIMDTHTIGTDFRRNGSPESNSRRGPDNDLHWMFMGAPIILHAEHLNIKGFGFGSIFEAAEVHMQAWDYRHKSPQDFRAAVNISDETITRGLTEFSTARIVGRLAPEFAEASLKSLANDGSEKLFRKEVLLMIEKSKLNGSVETDYSGINLPAHKISIGKSFAIDFLYYSFASNDSNSIVFNAVENVDELYDFKKSGISMSWVYAYNPSFIEQVPKKIVGDFVNRLSSVDIKLFSSSDFENYEKFRAYWNSKNRT